MALTVRVQVGAESSDGGTSVPAAAARRLMQRAARAALRRESIRDAEISITLLDDSAIAAMNREYLRHDGPTDVISFRLHETGAAPIGDIYIGYEQAQRNARANHVDAEEELARLAVHGVLHVLGHDHPAGAARTRSRMWRTQESILDEVLES